MSEFSANYCTKCGWPLDAEQEREHIFKCVCQNCKARFTVWFSKIPHAEHKREREGAA